MCISTFDSTLSFFPKRSSKKDSLQHLQTKEKETKVQLLGEPHVDHISLSLSDSIISLLSDWKSAMYNGELLSLCRQRESSGISYSQVGSRNMYIAETTFPFSLAYCLRTISFYCTCTFIQDPWVPCIYKKQNRAQHFCSNIKS